MATLSNRSKAALIAVLLIACCSILFLLRSAYQSGDSLTYAAAVRSGSSDMFHPHHLIFGPAVHVLNNMLSALSLPADVITAGQAHNVFWAAIVFLSMYALAMYLTGRLWFALVVMLVLFATRGVLTFTSWMEVYTPALGALCIVAWATLAAPRGGLGNGRMLICILSYSLAVLYHQTNVLFAIPLAVYFARSRSRQSRDWFVLLVGSGSLVLAAYLLAYSKIAESPSLTGFINFCLSYLSHPSMAWGSSGNLSPGGLQGVVSSQVWNIVALSSRGARAVPAMLLILLLLWNGWKGIREDRLGPERSFLLAWIATYWLFFLWWLPYQTEFFLVTLFPVILLAAVTLHEVLASRRLFFRANVAGTAVLAALAAFLLVQNLPSAWTQHIDRGESYRRARDISHLLAPDLLVMTDYHTGANLRFHFHHENVLETAIPLLLFYRHLELPRDYSLVEEKRCLVELSEVDPTYTLMGFSGYSHPSEWLSWVQWLLGFQHEPDGSCSFRTFSLMKDTMSGRSFMLVDDRRERVETIKEIFSKLDPYVVKNTRRPFAEWLAQNQS